MKVRRTRADVRDIPDDRVASLRPARLSARDLVRLGSVGLWARPMRAVLSALGIAIGIAAMVAVVGISTSGQAQLQQQLERLGTNLLTVSTGQDLFGKATPLPTNAPEMIERIRPVTDVSAIGASTAKVYRSDLIPVEESGGIGTYAADLDLLKTLGATVADGSWLNAATANYPAVVLGSTTAAQLGIDRAGPDVQVRVGGEMFTVVGILDPVVLADKLDTAALVGWPAAASLAGFDGHPTEIFTRTADDQVAAVRDVLAATANPAAPNEVKVSRPSDALNAAAAADQAFTGLLLGVGAVGLLVGGVGVANTMVISVLERRGEVGLRRALGATRGNIRLQFFSESLLLASFGGLAGVVIGVIATTLYASTQGWPTLVPGWASLGGMIATVVVGGIAGLYPAIRAARLAPSEALTAP
ncbi:ABC transporter permease [Agromyces sp. Root81]|uniref:ABC transporter permease n=1 Tax=Agromyces sp. Root81 TaxID=1736601 RepID=UPI0006F42D5B|nr:ABC transporter permease [Agromyces sp. Root81]KRC61190.1 ABC transporter permease [Agromyces sp. Root81]